MKRYISAILIPYLLMQLFGCYTQKEITYDEFTSIKSDDANIIVNDSPNFILNKNVTNEEIVMHPQNNYSIDAIASQDDLILYKKALRILPGHPNSMAVDTIKIKKEDVTRICINEYNGMDSSAVGTIVVIGLAVTFIAYVVWQYAKDFRIY